jgi:hypothetical protein
MGWGGLHLIWFRWGMRRRIRRFGWTATYIPEDESSPCFAYTTGFPESLGAPELIMFGFDPGSAEWLFKLAYDQIKAGELRLRDMLPWSVGWPEDRGGRLMWRAVHPSQMETGYFPLSLERGMAWQEMRAYQLVISDNNGVFPWEPDYDQSYRPVQPLLSGPLEGARDED